MLGLICAASIFIDCNSLPMAIADPPSKAKACCLSPADCACSLPLSRTPSPAPICPAFAMNSGLPIFNLRNWRSYLPISLSSCLKVALMPCCSLLVSKLISIFFPVLATSAISLLRPSMLRIIVLAFVLKSIE